MEGKAMEVVGGSSDVLMNSEVDSNQRLSFLIDLDSRRNIDGSTM